MKRKRTCGRCPKNDFGWCVIRAELRPNDAPACDYGKKIMHNAYSAEWMRRKHGYKERKRHDEGISGDTDRA